MNYHEEKAGKTKKSMSPNVQTQIIAMIKNCKLVEDHQLNSDSIYDFVAERTFGKRVRRFADVDSIQKWLYDENGNRSGKRAVIKPRPANELKKGQKIKINPPKDARTFSDLEQAQVVFQRSNANQSQSDEDIDVVSPYTHPSQWNTYAIAHQDLLKVSTERAPQQQQQQEKQQQLQHQRRRSIVREPKSKETAKRKRSQSSNENKKEPRFWCKNCDKKYQQNSSLLRHERKAHPAKRPNNSESPPTEL